MQKRFGLAVGFIWIPLTMACSPEPTAPEASIASVSPRTLAYDLPSDISEEGELLGQVWEGMTRSTRSDLYFRLEPLDALTITRLANTPFKEELWVNPDTFESKSKIPIQYYTPAAGAQCGGNGPSPGIDYFLSGNTTYSSPEVHRPASGNAPEGVEGHCIIPGRYVASLVMVGEPDSVLKSYVVDYVALAKTASGAIDVTTPDGSVAVERADTLFSHPRWPDLWVQYDLAPVGGAGDTPLLDVENAHSNPYDLSFVPDATPSGSTTDWFRYRVDRSSSTWVNGETIEPNGAGLARLWWDNANNPNERSGYFDSSVGGGKFLRVYQYKDIITSAPTNISIGLEIMRPDEPPANSPSATLAATITSVTPLPPTACWDPESSSTWRNTDQYFNASCSSGNDLEYSWDIGGGFGPYSDDPIFESFGYPTTGSKQVRLRVRDVFYSPPTTATDVQSVFVSSSLHTMSGPAYVTNKTLKTYTAAASSSWWERYDPPDTWPWYQILSSGTVYNRIWPAGEYVRGLRAQRLSGVGLARARIDVVVCHESIPGCDDPPPAEFVAGADFASMASVAAQDDWGLFGAGPWISTADEVARFYDLTGLHEPDSPFANLSWLEKTSGSATSSDGRLDVDWRLVETDAPDVKIVEFTVRSVGGGPYSFGMALDPDLGRSPADDRSGYEASHGLVFAADGENAVGFVLESLEGAGARAIDQYGTKRFAPRAPGEARAVGDAPGVRLESGEDDVQFIISGGERTGASSWRLLIVRGSSLRKLKANLDRADG